MESNHPRTSGKDAATALVKNLMVVFSPQAIRKREGGREGERERERDRERENSGFREWGTIKTAHDVCSKQKEISKLPLGKLQAKIDLLGSDGCECVWRKNN